MSFPDSSTLVALLNLGAGVASANFNLANVRITMATMPKMGANHFFALFTVITSLGLGGAPVAWGLFSMQLEVMKLSPAFFTGGATASTFSPCSFSMALPSPTFRACMSLQQRALPVPLFYEGLKRLARFWQR